MNKIAILGAGKLGATLISGIFRSKLAAKSDIIATTKHIQTAEEVATEWGVRTSTDNKYAVKHSDTIILAVKPQQAGDVLSEIRGTITPSNLLISVVASLPTDMIEKRLGKKIPVVRAMPNTPALVLAGMTTICGGKYVDEKHLDKAKKIFGAIGRVMVLDEKYFDAVTGLSASGPAFIYVVIESLAEGGVKAGLPREIATELVAQTMLGSSKLVLESGEHPAKLKDAVTTPAGCTIDGLIELEEGGLRVALIKAVVKASHRAKELIRE